jgi:hypothetical protein
MHDDHNGDEVDVFKANFNTDIKVFNSKMKIKRKNSFNINPEYEFKTFEPIEFEYSESRERAASLLNDSDLKKIY